MNTKETKTTIAQILQERCLPVINQSVKNFHEIAEEFTELTNIIDRTDRFNGFHLIEYVSKAVQLYLEYQEKSESIHINYHQSVIQYNDKFQQNIEKSKEEIEILTLKLRQDNKDPTEQLTKIQSMINNFVDGIKN